MIESKGNSTQCNSAGRRGSLTVQQRAGSAPRSAGSAIQAPSAIAGFTASRPAAFTIALLAAAIFATVLTDSAALADDAAGSTAPRITPGDDSASAIRAETPAGSDIVRRGRRSADRSSDAGDGVASRVSRSGAGLFRAADVLWPLALLGILLGLAILVKRLSRRGGGVTAASPVIEVLARTSLSPRQNLCLVRLGRRLVLLGVGGEQAHTLVEISDPVEAAELIGAAARARPGSISSQFGEFLRSAAAGFRETPVDDANRTAESGADAADRMRVVAPPSARSEVHRVTEQLRSLKLRSAGVV